MGMTVGQAGTPADVLTGGAGKDDYVFSAVFDSEVAVTLRDTITDFTQGADLIDLSAFDAITCGGHDRLALNG